VRGRGVRCGGDCWRFRITGPGGAWRAERAGAEVRRGDGIRVPRQGIRHRRDGWIARGIPAAEIDRAVGFQDRWGDEPVPDVQG
jgi:hypothetical protein